jgi:hypothetical protein
MAVALVARDTWGGSRADVGRPIASPDPSSAMLDIAAAIQAGGRHVSYVDRLTPTLRKYDLFAAPLAAVSGQYYPLGHADAGLLEGLGFWAEYARAFALSSQDQSGTGAQTTWQVWEVGAREQLS